MPACVVKTCTSLMRSFLWGGFDGDRKIAWVKRSAICQTKERGGLGIKDLTHFNKALLGKWLWRMRTAPNLLWCRVMSAKYTNGSCIRELTYGGKMSK